MKSRRRIAFTKVGTTPNRTRLQQGFATSEMGFRVLAEVAHYTRAADQQRLARQALEIQLGAQGERVLSNLPARLDKGSKKS